MNNKIGTVGMAVAVIGALLVLAGCGGGGGGAAAGAGSGSSGGQATYPIGGQLSGLVAGNQVVLQNNGTDDLVLDSDGGFTFATELHEGDSYQVTVATDADDCDCSVENGSGTVPAAAVTDVVVTCRHWRHPADLSDNISPDGQDAIFLMGLAVDAAGNAVIAWTQSDGSNRQLFMSEYR